MTPLSWCIVVSTIANVLTAAMVGWFLLARPDVHVSGGVSVYGGVRVNGGNVEVTSADKDAILKVQICEETSELSSFPMPPTNKPQMAPATHCASIDQTTVYGFKSYGLSAIPTAR
jgi:opacity protein-like surface antigen